MRTETQIRDEINALENEKVEIDKRISALKEALHNLLDEYYWRAFPHLPRLKAGDVFAERYNGIVQYYVVVTPHPSIWGGKVKVGYEEMPDIAFWKDVGTVMEGVKRFSESKMPIDLTEVFEK